MLNGITDQDLHVNKEQKVTIKRGRHDKEHPYVPICKSMLRDKNLTPNAKGVLCYLLSLPDTWITHPRQVAETLAISKNQMYAVLKQLIIAGYATKEMIKCEKGRFSSVVYSFFEQKLDTPQVYKEKITVSRIPETDNPYTEKGTLKNTDTKEYILDRNNNSSSKVPEKEAPIVASREEGSSQKEVYKKPKTSSEFSEEVKELAEKMVKAVHAANDDWLIPKNLHPVMFQIDEMINKENRDPKKIYDVFMWAISDDFWMDKFCKPNPAKYLRAQFGQLSGKMKAPQTTGTKVDRRLRDKDGQVVDAYKDVMF